METVSPHLMNLIPLDRWEKLESSKILNSHLRINLQPFEHLEQGVLFGLYFDYYNSWEKAKKENKNLNVLIVHFEHLKTNGLKELKRIQEFLEVNNLEKRLQQILNRGTVKQMKTDIDTGKVESVLKGKDGKSFLYRKGEIGDWKNHFTVAQSEYFNKIVEEQFKDSVFNL